MDNVSGNFLSVFSKKSICVISSKLMVAPNLAAYSYSFAGVSLEENIISLPESPIASESISSVLDEQSVPQPNSLKILIRYGFGVAFTAKYSLNPLFHEKASFNALAFSRIPFSS